jgi:hypothetical protein
LTLAREAGREEELARRLADAQRFSRGKHRMTAGLIAGRVTLRQAAERFQELDALLRSGEGDPPPVPTGKEAVWRRVLVWVGNELYPRRDPEAAAVLARLRAEYRERFGHDPEPLP